MTFLDVYEVYVHVVQLKILFIGSKSMYDLFSVVQLRERETESSYAF